MTAANRWVQRRLEAGLSQQADLAAAAQVPKSLISELEKGVNPRRDLGARKLYRMACALGVRMETLLELPPLPGGSNHGGSLAVDLGMSEAEWTSLKAAAAEFGWIEEDVAALRHVHFRHRRPYTVTGWWFLYESIRRAVLV